MKKNIIIIASIVTGFAGISYALYKSFQSSNKDNERSSSIVDENAQLLSDEDLNKAADFKYKGGGKLHYTKKNSLKKTKKTKKIVKQNKTKQKN